MKTVDLAKEKHGVHGRFMKGTFLLAKNDRLQIKEFRSTTIDRVTNIDKGIDRVYVIFSAAFNPLVTNIEQHLRLVPGGLHGTSVVEPSFARFGEATF